jgi:hypothetical protein
MRRWDVFLVGLTGVTVGALLVAMLPALAAQVGDPLSLGEVNKVDDRTDWRGRAQGAVVQVKNTGNSSAIAAKADKQAIVAKATDGPVAINAKADRVAVKIKVDPGQAPLKVNASAGTATNLSADLLDGMDSSAFLTPAGLLAASAHTSSNFILDSEGEKVMLTLDIDAPDDGTVIANSTVSVDEDTEGVQVLCSITSGITFDASFVQKWESGGVGDGKVGQLAGTRAFEVVAGQQLTVNLVCLHQHFSDGGSFLDGLTLTAIFIPDA